MNDSDNDRPLTPYSSPHLHRIGAATAEAKPLMAPTEYSTTFDYATPANAS